MLTLTYFLVGFVYWAINVFVRDLPSKNEAGDGWFLTPVWLFLWPICIAALIISKVSDYRTDKL